MEGKHSNAYDDEIDQEQSGDMNAYGCRTGMLEIDRVHERMYLWKGSFGLSQDAIVDGWILLRQIR